MHLCAKAVNCSHSQPHNNISTMHARALNARVPAETANVIDGATKNHSSLCTHQRAWNNFLFTITTNHKHEKYKYYTNSIQFKAFRHKESFNINIQTLPPMTSG